MLYLAKKISGAVSHCCPLQECGLVSEQTPNTGSPAANYHSIDKTKPLLKNKLSCMFSEGIWCDQGFQDLHKVIEQSIVDAAGSTAGEQMKKLMDSADLNGLQIINNMGDGSCQYEAVAHQLNYHYNMDVVASALLKSTVQYLTRYDSTVASQ